METTDGADGTDRQGLADRAAFTCRVNVFFDVQAKHHRDEHFASGDANKDGFLDPAEFSTHAEHKLKALEAGPVKTSPPGSNR